MECATSNSRENDLNLLISFDIYLVGVAHQVSGIGFWKGAWVGNGLFVHKDIHRFVDIAEKPSKNLDLERFLKKSHELGR